MINKFLLQMSGSSTYTECKDELPFIRGICLYRITDKGIREWATLNGINTGEFTRFFGAPCIGDTHEGIKVAEELIEQDRTLILKHIETKIL